MDTSAGVPAVCNREGSNPRTTNAGGERWRRHGNGLQQQHQSRSIHCRGLPPLRRFTTSHGFRRQGPSPMPSL